MTKIIYKSILFFIFPVVLVCIGSGCNSTIGGQFGTAAGRMADQYLYKAGVPMGGSITALTTTIGASLGDEINSYLTESERQRATAAARASLNSNSVGQNSTRTWSSSNSGTSGGSTVIDQQVASDGKQCRTQRNFINVGGKDVTSTATLCRDPNTGVWAKVA